LIYCWSQISEIFAPSYLCFLQKNQIPRVENPRNLAAAFAMAVTAQTPVGRGWIARNGKESLFRTLQRIMPQVSVHFINSIFFWWFIVLIPIPFGIGNGT
jgi:hypothetical protein